MSGVMIVDIAEYEGLKTLKRLYWLTLVIVVLLFSLVMFLIGVVAGQHKMLDKVQKLEHNVMVTQQEQKIVAESFVKAWDHQEKVAGLLIDWGTLVVERNKMITQNNTAISKK